MTAVLKADKLSKSKTNEEFLNLFVRMSEVENS